MINPVKSLAALLFTAAILLSSQAVAGAGKPLTVVELFTSQGCSSCPPADAYLGDLAGLEESRHILALSYHVDYWDNLGWKDPYSSPDNTRRQRAYASYMDLRYVYTPQMVIQGKFQGTGSDRQSIDAKIISARKLPVLDVRLKRKPDSLQVILGKAEEQVNASIFMVLYDNEHVTNIKRGENAGKTITNRNVVRAVKNIGSWTGEALNLSLPLGQGGDNCAVIIQSRATGKILGAASISIN